MKPLTANGILEIEFNQPLIMPSAISEDSMRKVLIFSHESSSDGKVTFGRIVSSKELQKLNSRKTRL